MKTLKCFILLLSLTTILNANLNDNVHLGISIAKKSTSQKNRIKSVIKKLNIEINKFFDEKIYIETIDNEEKIIHEFENFKKLNVIMINPNSYLENKNKLKKISQNLFMTSGEDKFSQFYLIANKKSKIKKLNDLKNKKFIFLTGNDNYINWLDFMTRRNLHIKYNDLFLQNIQSSQEHRLILDTYFGKADFTVVSKELYDDMLILNPSIKKNLIIIKKSEPIFMYALGFVHKNTPKKVVDRINKILFDKKFKNIFRDMLKLLDKSTMTRIEIKDLENLEKFYDEYILLKTSMKIKK